MRRVIAAERYEISVKPPSRWIVPGLAVGVYVVGLLTQQVWTYGRRRATIRDRTSGAVVGRFTEPWMLTAGPDFGWMLTHSETMSPSEFEQRWLESADNASCTRVPKENVRALRLLPAFVVDRLPIAWWRPGHLHRVLGRELHFCDGDHVRTIEWNGRTVAHGKRVFAYDHEWT